MDHKNGSAQVVFLRLRCVYRCTQAKVAFPVCMTLFLYIHQQQ